ncbi:MAG: DUF4760 domain-containing protein [Pseudomonadota bacterium]
MKEFFGKVIAASPFIEVILIFAAVVVAFFTYTHTKKVARKRATMDFILDTFLDEVGSDKYNRFKAILRRYDSDPDLDIKDLAEPSDNPETEEDRNAVFFQLNNYELVALGIHKNLFDEQFYKRWFHRQLTRDYRMTKELIEKIQNDSGPSKKLVYKEYSKLSKNWINNRLPGTNVPWYKKIWWSIWYNDEDMLVLLSQSKNSDDIS